MNNRWHEQNVMPNTATMLERMAWHQAHQEHCGCRPIPPNVLAQIRGVPTPGAKHRSVEATPVDSRFEPVVAAFTNNPEVSRGGKGFGAPGLKVNGKLFTMISSRGKFVAKLPKARVDELVRLGKGERFDPGRGRSMNEWIALEGETESWVGLAEEAYRFVKGQR